MDPALRELLKAGDDRPIEAIIKIEPGAAVPDGVTVTARFGSLATVRLPATIVRDVHDHAQVLLLKAPRVFGIEPSMGRGDRQSDAENDEPVAALGDERRPPGLSCTGRQVVVGVVDWGIDFAHPNFRHPDGSTRFLAIWNQADPRGAVAPYGYGVEFDRAAIDRALAADGDPYAALGLDPAIGDPTDHGAHGTHVLDIAAGNGRVPGSPCGIAPDAILLFVHLASRAGTERARLGNSVTLLHGLDWIIKKAGDLPLVINLSMGRRTGDHIGKSPVEQAIDFLLTDRPGRCCVHSCGNYYAAMAHSAGTLRPGGEQSFGWHAESAEITPNELEIWYPQADRFGIRLFGPDGNLEADLPLGADVALGPAGQCYGHAYHRANDPSGGGNQIEFFLYPGAPGGRREIRLVAEDVVDGRWHAWIERDVGRPAHRAHFDEADAVQTTTTGSICNGFHAIAVGAYDAHDVNWPLAPFSSSGPTRDGRPIPAVLAPGRNVLAARSRSRLLGDATPPLTLYSGTSMASPHVAGAVALIFESAGRKLRIDETRNLLLGTTRPWSGNVDDAARSGAGYLDIAAAVEHARRYASPAGNDLPAPGSQNVIGTAPLASQTSETATASEREDRADLVSSAILTEPKPSESAEEAVDVGSEYTAMAVNEQPNAESAASLQPDTAAERLDPLSLLVGGALLSRAAQAPPAPEPEAKPPRIDVDRADKDAAEEAGAGAAPAERLAPLSLVTGAALLSAAGQTRAEPEPTPTEPDGEDAVEDPAGDALAERLDPLSLVLGASLFSRPVQAPLRREPEPSEVEPEQVAAAAGGGGSAERFDPLSLVLGATLLSRPNAPSGTTEGTFEMAEHMFTETSAEDPFGLVRLLDHVGISAVSGLPTFLAQIGAAGRPSPALLFDLYRRAPKRWFDLDSVFTQIGRPGQTLSVPLAKGDCMLRRAFGEGGLAHIAVIVDPNLVPHTRLDGLDHESRRHGYYVQIMENWPRPITSSRRFHRLVLDRDGRVPLDQIILRPAVAGSSLRVESAQSDASEDFPDATTGPQGPGEEYYDPAKTGNPLLDASGKNRSKRLSSNFTVAELARFGARTFDKARIDPGLVDCLQFLHDFIRGPIGVVEGYASYKSMADLAQKQGTPRLLTSPHLSGRGAKIQASALSPLELAKSVIFACLEDTQVGVGDDSVTIYVKEKKPAVPFSYIGDGERRDRALATLRRYYDLYYHIPVDILEKLDNPSPESGKSLVHWAVYEKQVRDERILTEVLFYKSGWVSSSRQYAKVKGRYDEHDTWDRGLWDTLLKKAVRPVLAGITTPAQQRGGVPTTPKGEHVLVAAAPDSPGFDVTGRYETYYAKGDLLGMTLSVNQAGRHIELVFSPVLSHKVPSTTHRQYFRLHGDLAGGAKPSQFNLVAPGRPNLDFALVRESATTVSLITLGPKPSSSLFTRTSDAPFLTEAALHSYGNLEELIAAHEWHPLLTKQIDHLREFYGDPKTIGRYLKDFHDAKGDPLGKYDEAAKGDAAKKFNDAMTKWILDPALGFHDTNSLFAQFYIRYFLTLNQWRPSDSYPFLSELDWIYRMVATIRQLRREEPARSHDPIIVSEVVKYVGADPAVMDDGHVHKYKVTLNFSGLGFFLGYYRGTITIEKTDDRKWPVDKVRYDMWLAVFGVSFGLKRGMKGSGLGPLKFNETLVGTGTSSIGWLPADFPGQIDFAQGGGSVSLGVKGSAGGWFLHIHGRGGFPVLQITDEGASLGVGGLGGSGNLLGATGKIKDKDLPTAGYPSMKQETDFATAYGLTKNAYFGFDSAVLPPEARQAVRVMCANELVALMNPDSILKVTAHTDSKGSEEYNLALARLRANNTRQAIEDIVGDKIVRNIETFALGEAEAKGAGEREYRNLDRRRVDIELNGRIVLRLLAQ